MIQEQFTNGFVMPQVELYQIIKFGTGQNVGAE